MQILKIDIPEAIFQYVKSYYLDKKSRSLILGLNTGFPNQDKIFFDWVDEDNFIHLPYKDIIYIQHVGKLNIIHTTHGEIVCSGRLMDLFLNLDPTQFVLIHKSYILNEAYIYEAGYENVKIIENGNVVTLPIGDKLQNECSIRFGISRGQTKGYKNLK